MYHKALKIPTISLRASHTLYPTVQGTSLRHIGAALGHNTSKTTEIYTRFLAINNKTIKSPLDTMCESVSLDENKTTS